MKRKLNRICRLILKPYYEVLYAHQRVTRGFSDRDMFNADTFLARQMAGILRWYINEGHSVPCSYSKKTDTYCEDFDYMKARRDKEYEKYALMFEEYGKNGHAIDKKWKKKFGGLTDDEVHDMMTWLTKHFTELWD